MSQGRHKPLYLYTLFRNYHGRIQILKQAAHALYSFHLGLGAEFLRLSLLLRHIYSPRVPHSHFVNLFLFFTYWLLGPAISFAKFAIMKCIARCQIVFILPLDIYAHILKRVSWKLYYFIVFEIINQIFFSVVKQNLSFM